MTDKWLCDKCNWTGDEPDITPSYKFLGTDEDTTEEEYLETCPKCGVKQLVLLNPLRIRNLI